METIESRGRFVDIDRTPYTYQMLERFGWLKQYWDVMYYESVRKFKDNFREFQNNARVDDEKHLGEAALYVVEDYFRKMDSRKSDEERKHMLSSKIIFDELAQESEGSIKLNWIANMWTELRNAETELSVEVGHNIAYVAARYGCINALITMTACKNCFNTVDSVVLAQLPIEYTSTYLDRLDEVHALRNLSVPDLQTLLNKSVDFNKSTVDSDLPNPFTDHAHEVWNEMEEEKQRYFNNKNFEQALFNPDGNTVFIYE